MIIRARTVVTMDGAPIENGAVAVLGNRIVEVGRFDDVNTRNAGNTVDLGEQLLLPGLINAHCHLDYTGLRGKIAPQKCFSRRYRREMTTFFDVLTVTCFVALAIAFFLFTERDNRTLLHFMLAGIVFAVANQVGNAGSFYLALILILAGAGYAVLIVRR